MENALLEHVVFEARSIWSLSLEFKHTLVETHTDWNTLWLEVPTGNTHWLEQALVGAGTGWS